jgi:hypothetical protein
MDQSLKILTSYYYPSVYYGSAVWLGAITSSSDWKLLNKAHYQALRTATKDYRKTLSRRTLDTTCERATPKQWNHFCVASTAASIIVYRQPGLLCDSIEGNMNINSKRPARPSFFDSSRTRIGRKSIENRLTETFIRMPDVDWYRTRLSKDATRVRLKKAFFPYYLCSKVENKPLK